MQHFWHIMLYYFKKGKNTTETQKKICASHGEGTVTDQTCQKWFVQNITRDIEVKNNLTIASGEWGGDSEERTHGQQHMDYYKGHMDKIKGEEGGGGGRGVRLGWDGGMGRKGIQL